LAIEKVYSMGYCRDVPLFVRADFMQGALKKNVKETNILDFAGIIYE
jgi:hypothetical protein